ncbi:hypothetical protein M2401_001098 [Pseudomonas sp. JUb42]|uniref:phage antirepressor N-terminal domain-containing protein n=1 Tax=Pseudomonas sp. JUb42 TaxID=2940611 RepID=UPI002167BEBB|nr:phage antirepressor N-terminal domain-containing protein [Pseudomonas sp. JUb42]MCS3467377.1 hypothetical protein [Pseudomonas sp. JUb42]
MPMNYAAAHHVIEFHSKQLLLVEHQETPYVPLVPILEGIGLESRSPAIREALKRFKSTLIKLSITYNDCRCSMQCLSLNKLAAWLMAIDLGAVKVSVRKNLITYQNGCDEVLWKYWLNHRACTAPAVNLVYEGHRFRFRAIGSECWYVATDVAAALGLRDTETLLQSLPENMRLTQQIIGRRRITINQAGLNRAYLMAPPHYTERLRLWLANLNNDGHALEASPDAYIRLESANATLDYLARARGEMRDAGLEPVEWDEARAQEIAKNLPWLLIRNQRWLFTFSQDGTPQFSPVPQNAGVFTPENVVRWVRESDGADVTLLPQLLCAIGERLKTG